MEKNVFDDRGWLTMDGSVDFTLSISPKSNHTTVLFTETGRFNFGNFLAYVTLELF